MLGKDQPVALIAPNQQASSIAMNALAESGYRKVTIFTSGVEAYEVCSRQQFTIFLTHVAMPDMSGLSVIQKLRQTGNYGLEPHLIIANKIEPKLMLVLLENDLPYVTVAPHTKASIAEKFKHMIEVEGNLPPIEQKFRDAKSAYIGGILDMAEQLTTDILAEEKNLEKAILLLGDIRLKQNHPERARELYQQAISINPKSAVAAHKIAQSLMSLGDFQNASDMLNRLAEINPYNISLLENAGKSNLSAQRIPEAMAHMKNLFALDAKNQTATAVTAEAKIASGDYEGIVDVLRRGFDEKELVQFLNNAGAKLSKESDIEGALRMYKAAVEQLPEDNKYLYAIYYNMGIAHKKLGILKPAKTFLERSLKLNKTFDKAAKALKDLGQE